MGQLLPRFWGTSWNSIKATQLEDHRFMCQERGGQRKKGIKDDSKASGHELGRTELYMLRWECSGGPRFQDRSGGVPFWTCWVWNINGISKWGSGYTSLEFLGETSDRVLGVFSNHDNKMLPARGQSLGTEGDSEVWPVRQESNQ